MQRKVRVPAAVMTQRAAQRAVPGPDGGLQMGPLVGAQPGHVRLVPIALLRAAPGHLTQEPLPAGIAWCAAAPLVPGQERPVRWRREGKGPPPSRITGHLGHADDTTFAREHPVPGRQPGSRHHIRRRRACGPPNVRDLALNPQHCVDCPSLCP